MFLNHEISLFFETQKTYKNQLNFNDFVFTKIHLENPYRIFAVRISVFDRDPLFCCTSAAVLTFFFWPCHLRPSISRAVRALSTHQIQFAPLKRNVL